MPLLVVLVVVFCVRLPPPISPTTTGGNDEIGKVWTSDRFERYE